jgi:outer membrane protein assembly factor BamB
MKPLRHLPLALLAASPLFLAADWPEFLGPQRNSHSAETGLRTTWPEDGPPVVWHKDIGEGFSGPVVAGGRLVLFHRQGGEQVLECFDAASGKSLWKEGTATQYEDPLGKGDGPRSTPLVAKGQVYALSPEGLLICRKLADGKKVWQRDLLKDYEVPPSFFGVGTSPVLADKLLLVNVGGKDAGVVAFDRQSGKEVWKSTTDGASYSSPVLATIDGVRSAIFFTRLGVVVLDPANGKVRFQQRWRSRMDASVNAAAPVVWDGHLFFTACYGTGALLLRADKDGFEEVWKSDRVLSCHFSTPIYQDGNLYGFDGRQESGTELRCIEARTGKVRWSKEGFGCGSMIEAEGGLFVMSEGGELVRLACNPERYQETARARVLQAPCRAQIALSGGRLYGRDATTMKCWNLKK